MVPRTSGSIAATFEGGGSGGSPSRRSITNAPRGTGLVVVPFAVIFRIEVQQFAEGSPRFRHHRVLQIGAELGIQLAIRVIGSNIVELQPLPQKIVDEPV